MSKKMDPSQIPEWWDSNNWTWNECRDYLKAVLQDGCLLSKYRDELGDLAEVPFRKLPDEVKGLVVEKESRRQRK